MSRIKQLNILLLSLLPFAVSADQDVVETFGAWSKICAEFADSGDRCQIVQSVNQTASKQRIFQTAVGYEPGNDKPIMFLTAPLGIFLPRGISVKVGDEAEGLTASIQRCDASGCLAVMVMEEDFVSSLVQGRKAKIYFSNTSENRVSVPLNLDGFKQAFNSLSRD
jgi:invasion protein IalB